MTRVAARAVEVPVVTSFEMRITETVGTCPINGDGSVTLSQQVRVVQVARGQMLPHSGIARAKFAVVWNNAYIARAAGQPIEADDEQRAFFEHNNLPIDWTTP